MYVEQQEVLHTVLHQVIHVTEAHIHTSAHTDAGQQQRLLHVTVIHIVIALM